MTFFVADIPGILTVFARVNRIQIVRRISCGQEQFLLAAAENRQFFLQGRDSLVVSVQKFFPVLDREDGDRIIQCLELRELFTYFVIMRGPDIVIF